MKHYLFIIILSTLASHSYAADKNKNVAKKAATDKAITKKIATCIACHGKTGISNIEIYPNLAGQNKKYLISAIKAYKNGNRKGGLAGLMTPMVAKLSDQDIAEIAEFYSKQKLN